MPAGYRPGRCQLKFAELAYEVLIGFAPEDRVMRRVASVALVAVFVGLCLACGGQPASVARPKIEIGNKLAATGIEFGPWQTDAYGDLLSDVLLPPTATREIGSLDITTTHYTAEGIRLRGGTLSYPSMRRGDRVRAKLTFPSTGQSARVVLDLE